MISIIHPSRNRLQKSYQTMVKWVDNMHTKDCEVIVCLDSDDPSVFDYINQYGQNFKRDTGVAPSLLCQCRGSVDAINIGAKNSEGDILMVVSDDTDCLDGWDNFLLKLVKLVNRKTDWILKTQDGTQPWIITNPIMDRTYYNRFGYIYHPEYKHMFCDTELTCVADLTGRKITSNILFKHNHYSVTKEPPDAISKRADSTWDQGEKLFLERYKRNFDLPPDQIKGKIEDNGMINWLQRKVR